MRGELMTPIFKDERSHTLRARTAAWTAQLQSPYWLQDNLLLFKQDWVTQDHK